MLVKISLAALGGNPDDPSTMQETIVHLHTVPALAMFAQL